MKRISPFFLLLTSIIILGLFSSFIIYNAKATTYYNWLDNPSFELSDNSIINPNFESGNGMTGWTFSSASIETTYSYSAPNSTGISFNDAINQTFTAIPVTNISEISFYARVKDGYTGDIRCIINYTDNTGYNYGESQYTYADYGLPSNPSGDGLWHKFVLNLAKLDNAKSVKSIYLDMPAGSGSTVIMYLDNFYVKNNYAYSVQSDITFGGNGFGSRPWYIQSPLGIDHFTATEYITISSVRAYDGSYSCLYFSGQGTDEISGTNGGFVYQEINYLNSSTVANFSGYVYPSATTNPNKVYLCIYYSDGTTTFQEFTPASDIWTNINITSLSQNKLIIGVGFAGTKLNNYFFDDFKLYSTLDNTQNNYGFSYTLNPNAIQKDTFSFVAYQNQQYLFTGYFDTSNGLYTVTTSKGSSNGYMVSGVFSFQLTPRDKLSVNSTETIILNLDGFLINIYATWIPNSTPSNTTPSNTQQVNMQSQFLTYFPMLIVFCLFIIPATYKLGSMGFILGLDGAVLFCTWFGLLPTWGLAILLLINIVAIFFFRSQPTQTNTSDD